jgi:hypothetical protein
MDSTDGHAMRYPLRRRDRRWIGDRMELAAKPTARRRQVPAEADPLTTSGLAPRLASLPGAAAPSPAPWDRR